MRLCGAFCAYKKQKVLDRVEFMDSFLLDHDGQAKERRAGNKEHADIVTGYAAEGRIMVMFSV